MGHYQQIVICDAGFPIPSTTQRIDIALEPGIPSFLTTLKVVLKELQVEQIIITQETITFSPKRFEEMTSMFPDLNPKIISHDEFKELSKNAVACIRSGECTTYSNIILVSGVTY